MVAVVERALVTFYQFCFQLHIKFMVIAEY